MNVVSPEWASFAATHQPLGSVLRFVFKADDRLPSPFLRLLDKIASRRSRSSSDGADEA